MSGSRGYKRYVARRRAAKYLKFRPKLSCSSGITYESVSRGTAAGVGLALQPSRPVATGAATATVSTPGSLGGRPVPESAIVGVAVGEQLMEERKINTASEIKEEKSIKQPKIEPRGKQAAGEQQASSTRRDQKQTRLVNRATTPSVKVLGVSRVPRLLIVQYGANPTTGAGLSWMLCITHKIDVYYY